MLNVALTRTSDVSARVVATLCLVLGLTIFPGDAARASLVNFISVSTTCVSETHNVVTAATGPVANTFSSTPCADPAVPYAASASASSSVDYGIMRTSGEAAASPVGGSAYASVTPTLISSDALTFMAQDPTLSGQPGTVQARMQLQATIPGPGYFELTVSDSGTSPTWTHTWSTFDGYDCSALCTFDFSFPVTFDTPSPLVIRLVASVAAGVGSAFASFDLSHSLYWDGIQSATVGGQPVPFTLTSNSGHDWTQSSVPSNGNTQAGSNVNVDLNGGASAPGGVSISFAQVTGAGDTTGITSSSCPAVPSGFSLGTPAVCYDLNTTALFTPPVRVCINYSGVSFPSGQIALLHNEGGTWVDVTTSVDTTNHVVCGNVNSLSPFAVAARVRVLAGPSVPVPTLSQWGLITLAMLIVVLAAGHVRTRRP